jgi:hypothetical protein
MSGLLHDSVAAQGWELHHAVARKLDHSISCHRCTPTPNSMLGQMVSILPRNFEEVIGHRG